MPAKKSDDVEPRPDLWNLPLLDFIEAASGGRMKSPIHLREAAELISMCERLEVVGDLGLRGVVDAPVQHGKTTLLEWAIAWILLRHPDRPIIYCTYGTTKAEKHSRRIRDIFTANGGRIKTGFNTIGQWETEEGGGLLAQGVDGTLTGNPAAHVFFDDPYKNRQEAESADHRELIEEKLSSEVVTRMWPTGSILIIASRWHEEDLSGKKIAQGYIHVHLRAITRVVVGHEEGVDGELIPIHEERALCEWGPDPRAPRTLAFLRALRDGPDVTEYDWLSLYQGEPRPQSGGLFKNVALYDEKDCPPIVRVVIGCDFAYSRRGDRIALVVLGEGSDGIYYVLHVAVWQFALLENIPVVRAELATYEGCAATVCSYVAGPERGIIRHINTIEPEHGGPIKCYAMSAAVSKYIRSGATARRWNTNGVRVLRGRPWTDLFVSVVCGFTGREGDRDDETDALVSAHDMMVAGKSLRPAGGSFTHGSRVM